MELNDFIKGFGEQLDETDPATLTKDTVFKDLDEWNSLTSLALIAFVRSEFDKSLTGSEINSCASIEDLYNLVKSK